MMCTPMRAGVVVGACAVGISESISTLVMLRNSMLSYIFTTPNVQQSVRTLCALLALLTLSVTLVCAAAVAVGRCFFS